MSTQKSAFTFILLIVFLINTKIIKAQPRHFNQIFHPQTKENIGVMEKSPQKIEVRLPRDIKILSADSLRYITFIKKYNAKGLLVYYHNNVSTATVK